MYVANSVPLGRKGSGGQPQLDRASHVACSVLRMDRAPVPGGSPHLPCMPLPQGCYFCQGTPAPAKHPEEDSPRCPVDECKGMLTYLMAMRSGCLAPWSWPLWWLFPWKYLSPQPPGGEGAASSLSKTWQAYPDGQCQVLALLVSFLEGSSSNPITHIWRVTSLDGHAGPEGVPHGLGQGHGLWGQPRKQPGGDEVLVHGYESGNP